MIIPVMWGGSFSPGCIIWQVEDGRENREKNNQIALFWGTLLDHKCSLGRQTDLIKTSFDAL